MVLVPREMILDFTSVPNCFFDYWMSRILPSEFLVLLCISRNAFISESKTAFISLNSFEEMTSLCRSTIVKCIHRLVELDLIEKVKSKDEFLGGDNINEYKVRFYND
jgi:DNA-binding MarR family transcriptional regulator